MGALFGAYFAFVGAFSPFLGLYLSHLGLSIAQIGVLLAVPQLLRIVGPPFWGWMAGRAAERRLLVAAAAGMIAGSALLALPGAMGGVAAVLVLLFFASSGVVPIAEAVALRETHGDSGRYGRLRIWGSVGFIAAVSAGGPLLDAVGVAWLPGWMLAMAVLVFWAARRTGAREPAPRRARTPGQGIRARLREPAVAAFFAQGFLMIVAHSALYAFYSLHLERMGFSKTLIGAMWSVGVAAEIAVFALQRRLFERVDAARLLRVALWVAAARFVIIAACGDGLAWLLAAQLLHAVTFGVHHSASVLLLHRWFPPEAQARAQAVNIVVCYGLGGSLGGLGAAWAWEALSPQAMFMAAALAAAAGGVVMQLAAGKAAHGGEST